MRRRRSAGGTDQRADLLSVEGQIQRDERLGRPETEGAGGREPTAEEASGGVDAGRVGVEGSPGKKLDVTPVSHPAITRVLGRSELGLVGLAIGRSAQLSSRAAGRPMSPMSAFA